MSAHLSSHSAHSAFDEAAIVFGGGDARAAFQTAVAAADGAAKVLAEVCHVKHLCVIDESAVDKRAELAGDYDAALTVDETAALIQDVVETR